MPGEDLHLPEWVRFEAHWSACKARRQPGKNGLFFVIFVPFVVQQD